MRDFQRKAVYTAERALPEHDNGHMDIHGCRAFVQKVLKSKRVFKLTHIKTNETLYRDFCQSIEVRDGRGTRWAKGGRYFISLPKWARTKLVILHELAHSFTIRRYSNAKHGPEFCHVFLNVVRMMMGKEVAGRLEESFCKQKVDYFLE